MNILIIIHKVEGTVETSTVRKESLYTDDKDLSDVSFALSTLNNEEHTAAIELSTIFEQASQALQEQ